MHAILLIFKPVKHQYKLQYFSYHYHHYNEHYISKFWQVHNLRLPFHYLPKFTFGQVCSLVVFVTCQNLHFGKYVRWSCLLLLAKILFWQVCSLVAFVCLLLAKIWFWQVCSLVVFVTCQNYHFGKYVGWSCLLLLAKCNFGKYVRWSCLFVCLSVWLFVRKFHKISRTTQSIITKLGHKQALVHDSCKFVGQECRSNN